MLFKSRIVRLVISVILLYIAMQQIDLQQYVQNVLSIQMIGGITIALLFNSVIMCIISYRWMHLLFSRYNRSLLLQFTQANYIGAFYNLVLPTTNGGDFVKWSFLKDTQISKKTLIASVFVDRYIGILALLFVGVCSLLISIGTNIYTPDINITILLLFSCFIWATLFIYAQCRLQLPAFFPKYVQKKYQELLRYNAELRYLLLVSIFSQLIACLGYFVLGLYWGFGIQMGYIFIFFPIITALLLLPISIGGLGYKEVIFIYFFSQVGFTADQILLITTSNTMSRILIAFIGWLISTSSITNTHESSS